MPHASVQFVVTLGHGALGIGVFFFPSSLPSASSPEAMRMGLADAL